MSNARVFALILAAAGAAAPASATTLDQFLSQVRARNKSIQALERSREAATSRREAGDIELSPVLTAKVQSLDDQKPQPFGTFLMERTKANEYSLGIGKKFSTGTQAQVTASATETTVDARDLSSPTPFGLSTTTANGALGISLSQSLWKDGFGAGTRQRRERERVVEAAERQSYDLQEKRLLIDAESAFWDHLYLQEELAQRKDSLERAKRIETWVRRRVSNGIGDEADLYNAQGLVAGRELQLLGTEDEIRASEQRLRDLMEIGEAEKFLPLSGDLDGARRLEQMAPGGSGRRVRLDSWLAALEAKTRAIAASEVEEAYKPDLVLSGQYRTNSTEPTLSEATGNISDASTPTTAVALSFTWMLDGGLKNSARHAARAEALAASLRKERQLLESQSSWNEINRRHAELTRKIAAAGEASRIQTKKAAAERDKLSKGRTITSQVITAEQDAAESQLTLTKLRAEQRKLEAQGRLFVTVEE